MDGGQKTTLGRPRSFDTDDALERAMRVFWEHGYEGASLTDLTRAMGITRTSMYAAFGNKEELFRRVLQHYTDGPASYALRAVQQTTAQQVAAAFLTGSVAATTNPDCPAGCLGVQGSLAAGATAAEIRDILIAWRQDGVALLRDRFQQALDDGELPAGVDPGLLARYLMTVANGIAVQAATGVSREDLQSVADAALRNWPPV
jgi:AcrR family transcriptional regulator